MGLRSSVLALATLLSALDLLAQARPDFSGDYVLNREKSQLQVRQAAELERGVVGIAQKGSSFKFARVFTARGKDDPFSYQLMIGDKEVAGEEDGMKTFSRIYWDNDALVYETRMLAPRGEATNVVRYTLEEGGNVLHADETFHGPWLSYRNLWVFDRKR
jgi:hypothetical protein